MNIILLSGGSGKRLWPLSNDIRSKQFIKIFKNGNEYESMVQRIYRLIKQVEQNSNIVIATSKSQVSSIHNQLGEDVSISVEPYRKDTFPAIALAAAYLHEIEQISEEEAVVVCPVDPFVDESYFHCINALYELALHNEKSLFLMGIKPTFPSDRYGYIRPKGGGYIFTEKPDKETAQKYISEGALWNGGVFAFKLKYVLDKVRTIIGSAEYNFLLSKYATFEKKSFDYAVVEKETSIGVIEFNGKWKDIGTWNTLTEAMEDLVIGKGIISDECSNVHIINEMDVPILALGLHDVIVSASPEGILVSDKERSSNIKPYVEGINQQIMFAEKSWGTYKVIDVENEGLTIKISLNPGDKMNYHSHDERNEVWVVISGKGKTIINSIVREVKSGDVITMPAGSKHTIIAYTKMTIIEVQVGKDINVHDKHKYNLDIVD